MKKDKKKAMASLMKLSLLLFSASLSRVITASMISIKVINYRDHFYIIIFTDTTHQPNCLSINISFLYVQH
jgi:hypothetical protein